MIMLILLSIPMLILSSSVDAFSEKIVRSELPEVPGSYCDRLCDRDQRFHCVFNFRFETRQNLLNCSTDTRYLILNPSCKTFLNKMLSTTEGFEIFQFFNFPPYSELPNIRYEKFFPPTHFFAYMNEKRNIPTSCLFEFWTSRHSWELRGRA